MGSVTETGLAVAGIGHHVQDPDQRCGGTKDDA
jgi:hypothetical protein